MKQNEKEKHAMWVLFNRDKEKRKMTMAICQDNSAGAQETRERSNMKTR